MGDPTKLRLSPAVVKLGGIDVGYTSFGTAIEVQDVTKGVELKAAQEGDTPIDIVLTGHTCTVKVPMVEVDPTKLAMAIPNSELAGGRLTVKNRIGLSLRSLAQVLTITRLIAGVESADPADTLTFPLVTAMPGTVTQVFDANKQQELTVTFQAWTDPVTKEFYHVG